MSSNAEDRVLGTYVERLPQVRREFVLFRDHVLVRARWLVKGRFERSVPLGELNPDFRKAYVRNRLFKYAGVLTALGIVVAAWGLYPQVPNPFPWWATGGIVATAAGALGMAFTARRILFVCFDTKQGRPGLDIARAGPQRANFDAFVRQVQRQIRAARD